jgi:hypothetical protein
MPRSDSLRIYAGHDLVEPTEVGEAVLALAKDPKHPDQTFLGPRSYIRGQTRDRMPRQGIAEITRHGSNGFLVGLENQRELVLAPPSRYTMNPGATLLAPPRAAPFSRDLRSAGWPKIWLASTRIQWL